MSHSNDNSGDDPSPLDEVKNQIQNGKQFPFPALEGEDSPEDEGLLFQQQLRARSQAILNRLMNLLPSYYRSEIPSNQYSFFMRAMSTELARLTIVLEQLRDESSFREVRSEFLYEIVGNLVFVNDEIPDLEWNDELFRNFLLQLIDLYFEGSTPMSIRESVELFLDAEDPPIEVREHYKDANKDHSNKDISDQFGFSVVFDADSRFPSEWFQMKEGIQTILALVKPAHTLYQISHRFSETLPDPEDASSVLIDDKRYEDVRSHWRGMSGWSSSTGKIKQSSFRRLYDEGDETPLSNVQHEALLVVESGTNRGRYRVTKTPDHTASDAHDWVEVYPAFDNSETDVSYRVETDLKGGSQERSRSEDVSDQFGPDWRLEAFLADYQVSQGQTIQIKASTSYDNLSRLEMTFDWDFTGDGQYDDASGRTVTFGQTFSTGEKEVRVRVEASLYNEVDIALGTVHVT